MSSKSDVSPGYSEADFRVYGCRINRETLERILTLVTKDFSEEVVTEISTVRKSGDISSHISAASIDELLSRAQEAATAGDPSWIENLQITVHEPYGKSDNQRRVSIWIQPSSVWGKVSGRDSSWVRGRVGEVVELLKGTRVKWVVPMHVRAGVAGGAFVVYASLAVILVTLVISSPHPRLLYAVLLWVLMALFLIAWFVARKITKRSGTQIRLVSSQPVEKRDWVALLTLVGTLLILIATVVGVVYSMVH